MTDDLVRAAAEAMEDAALELLGRDMGTIHRDEIARRAVDAAAPLIRQAVLTEVAEAIRGWNDQYERVYGDAKSQDRLWIHGYFSGTTRALRVVRELGEQ